MLPVVCRAGSAFHSADTTANNSISFSEILRVVQLFNGNEIQCDVESEDGYASGSEIRDCQNHDSDYAPVYWQISLAELLRVIQFYNTGSYFHCPGESEDDYCPGMDNEGEEEGEFELVLDANLLLALRAALLLDMDDPLPPELIATLEHFQAPLQGIEDLTGLEHATALTSLDLHGNCIEDLTPLSNLTSLGILNLHGNNVSDISPLSGLTSLRLLWLDHNNIADPSPLLDNAGLGDAAPPLYDRVALAANPLDAPEAAAAIETLKSRGVGVWVSPAVDSEIPACAPLEEAGDPLAIDVRLIHGDPTLDDSKCYVIACMGDAFSEADLDDPYETVASVPENGHSFSIRSWSRAIADSVHFMLSQEPFTEYASYLKVYRVDLVSADGELSDNRDDPPTTFDTALGMARETLSFSFDDAMVRRVADATGLPWDRIVLMPNSVGSGKNIEDITMFSNVKKSRTFTALHEIGHGIGGLTDEYEYQHGTNPPTSAAPALRTFPNAISMGDTIPALEEIPWRHWIDSACPEPDNGLGDNVDFDCEQPNCQCGLEEDFVDCVPLPTCEPGGNFVTEDGAIYGRSTWPEPGESTTVGLYEGAWFRTKGAYRPELRCRMRSDDDSEPDTDNTPKFCKVCREALNLAIADDTGNVLESTPPTGIPLSLANTGSELMFSIELRVPASLDHIVEVEAWHVDGVLRPGETDLAFTLDVSGLEGDPPHTVSVTTVDRSPFVLENYAEGQARLRQITIWSLLE